MRARAPATAPPISAPRWGDEEEDGEGVGVGGTVCMIMFVVVMRSPLAAEVTMETTEMTLTRLVGDCTAAPPPAFLVVDVGVGVGEVDEDVDEVSLDAVVAVSPLMGFPMMSAEGTAGPVVLIEATEVPPEMGNPSDNGKKSLELELSQQTLDALRLWSQHQSPP